MSVMRFHMNNVCAKLGTTKRYCITTKGMSEVTVATRA
jgi:hypothetical protein